MSNSNSPEIVEIHEVKMYNPETDRDEPLESIDFKGITDIFEHPDIVERRNNDWVVRGFSADIDFRNKKYEITVSGNSIMGYVKIDSVAERGEAEDLQSILRDAFYEHFRFR